MMLQLVLHHGPVALQRRHALEKGIGRRKDGPHLVVLPHTGDQVAHVALRGAAAMIADPIKAHHLGQIGQRLGGRLRRPLDNVRLPRAAIVQRRPTGQDSRSSQRLPPKGTFRQGLFVGAGSEEDIVIQSAEFENLGQGAGVSE